MNRYEIRNIASGKITHRYKAESPQPDQPEWGKPGTYEVIVTDLTAELKAEKDAKDARKKLIKDLKKASTLEELKGAIIALAKELGQEVD